MNEAASTGDMKKYNELDQRVREKQVRLEEIYER
jgi:hypothetical protein